VITQISTSVQLTTEVVALMPTALTMRAASRAPVYLDTPEIYSPAVMSDILYYCWSVSFSLPSTLLRK